MCARRRFLLCLAGIGLAAASRAVNLPVTTTADSGAGSLRQAILDSNASVGTLDTISFNIPGSGVQVISPTSTLPSITDPVVIDGYTQPGASPNVFPNGDNAVILIEVDGSAAGIINALFDVQAGNTTIKGLSVVNGQTADGIAFVGGGGGLAVGNFIGLLPDGTTTAGNGCAGIRVNAPSTTVGGPAPADRNVISGAVGCGINLLFSATNGVAKGNYIGTSRTGASPRGGSIGIDLTGTGHQIGGTGPGDGNLISGNQGDGVRIRSGTSGNVLEGNFIGVALTGTVALPNARGISITDAGPNVIGGAVAGAANVLSGNGGNGIEILGTSSGNLIQGNRIGTDASGTLPIPNGGSGFVVTSGSGSGTVGGTAPGQGNVIAFNAVNGVRLLVGSYAILGNSIHDNGAIGIDLLGDGPTPNDPNDVDSGPNNLQNFPVLTSALATPTSIRIQGTLNAGIPFASGYRIEFFSSPACDPSGFGEGTTFLGFEDVMTDAGGNAAIDATFPAQNAAGSAITATTTIVFNTSEFSACLTAAPQSMAYFPVPPCRVVDTRNPNGPLGGPALAPNAERTFVVRGTCGVPTSALAVSLNVAVTLESAGGDLRIFPAGTLLPLVSAINYDAFKTRSNNAVIGLGVAGDLTVHVDQPAGTVHLILDVDGYFQ